MTETARRYAEALFDLMPDEALLRGLTERIQASPPLWEALTSPAVSREEKCRVLERLNPAPDTPALVGFLRLLAVNGRFALLPEILAAFHALALSARGESEGTLTCVTPPDTARLARMEAVLSRRLGKKGVHLIVRTDPALLGGFVVNLDGVTYDYSVRGRLRRLTRYLGEGNTA